MQIDIKTIISFLAVAFSNIKGNAEPREAIGARLRTQIRIFNTCILCQILHSFPYFFLTIFPTAFYDRSRMTGRYLIPFYKTHSDISTHTYFRSFMFTHTCPFRQLRCEVVN